MPLFRLSDNAAPLLSFAGIPVAIVLALVMLWPIAITGQLSGFQDSNSYIRGGDAIWRVVGEKLLPAQETSPLLDSAIPESATTEATNSSLGDTSNLYGRSITYAAAFTAVIRTAGPVMMAFLHALMIAFAILAMIQRPALQRPALLATGLLIMIGLSQVAWLSVYLMPDILGAVVLIFAALLVARFDRFSKSQQIFLTLLAAFAVSTHYGNIPLAFAVIVAALFWRYVINRHALSKKKVSLAVIAGLFVVIAAPLLNMTASFAVMGEMSMTPLRPPVVLARSLEDGPARWYLEEECADNDDSYCAAFDGEVTDKHYEFLWGEKGVTGLDTDTAQSVRENEWKIVLAAALKYPWQQFRSIVSNASKQFTLVGEVGREVIWNKQEFEISGPIKFRSFSLKLMAIVTITSAIVLAIMLFSGRLNRSQKQILAVITLGLVVNALIFGALSAPAGRYQARVAWLLPLLLVLFLAENGIRKNVSSLQRST